MANRFSKYLIDLLPRTGRMIAEDGTAVNEADVYTNVLAGNNAFVVQPYTEANVKRGLQFYIRASYPLADPIAAGATRKLHFQLGAKPLIVKLREFEYVGEEFQIQIFSGPTGVTGGTNIPVSNWNRANPQPSTVTFTKDVTTTDDGTLIEPTPEYFFGSSTQPNQDVTSIPQGRERILPAGSSFIVAIKNNNGQPSRCQYFLDWFEGETDIS